MRFLLSSVQEVALLTRATRPTGLSHDLDLWHHQRELFLPLPPYSSVLRLLMLLFSVGADLLDAPFERMVDEGPPTYRLCVLYVLDSSIVSQTDTSVSTVGVLWWAGGALGVFMSMGGKRHWVPAMVCVHSSFSSDPSITAD